jgi:hypothetical protein
MWEPQRLTTLWAFTACYRDGFTLLNDTLSSSGYCRMIGWLVNNELKGVCKEAVVAYVGFEVLTAVVIKSNLFWDITPCSLLEVNRRFGGKYLRHLQGRRIIRVRYHSCAFYLLSRWFLAQLILRPWRWRWYFPPKCLLTFNGLHGVNPRT